MVRRICGRPSWLFTVALFASLIAAVPAFAQSTGMVKGVVLDDKNQPVVDATLRIVERIQDRVDPREGRLHAPPFARRYCQTLARKFASSAIAVIAVRIGSTFNCG